MLLEHRKAQHENQDEDHELSEVFTKTLEYCQTFSKYNSRETISAVRGWVYSKIICFYKTCLFTNLHCTSSYVATDCRCTVGRFRNSSCTSLRLHALPTWHPQLQRKQKFSYLGWLEDVLVHNKLFLCYMYVNTT